MSSAGRTETRDVDARRIALFGGGLAGFILLALLLLALIYGIPPHPLPFGFATGLFERNVPVLQADPHADLQAYRVEKQRLLHGFGWVDRGAGIARIPIDEAMKIIAERGVPDWGQATRFREEACALLAGNVPRVPAAQRCLRAGPPEKH
jgi:hypothetical protein